MWACSWPAHTMHWHKKGTPKQMRGVPLFMSLYAICNMHVPPMLLTLYSTPCMLHWHKKGTPKQKERCDFVHVKVSVPLCFGFRHTWKWSAKLCHGNCGTKVWSSRYVQTFKSGEWIRDKQYEHWTDSWWSKERSVHKYGTLVWCGSKHCAD